MCIYRLSLVLTLVKSRWTLPLMGRESSRSYVAKLLEVDHQGSFTDILKQQVCYQDLSFS
jgi:hypothetical protein